jgi:hypothetical protein
VTLVAERLGEAPVEYWMRFWPKAEWLSRWPPSRLRHYAFLLEAEMMLIVWEEGILTYLQADSALLQ